MAKAVYPGSFDPPHNGHLDVIQRGSRIFGQLIVAVARNPEKSTLFSTPEREELLRALCQDLKNVEITSFDGLAVEYVRKRKANMILRGIRTISDYEYELQLALTNRALAQDVETVFVMTSELYSYISSRLVREAAGLGADLQAFVPPLVQKALRKKLKIWPGSNLGV